MLAGMGTDAWDQSLRDARECGEVVVVRGEHPDWEVELVVLDPEAEDPEADACRRAFAD